MRTNFSINETILYKRSLYTTRLLVYYSFVLQDSLSKKTNSTHTAYRTHRMVDLIVIGGGASGMIAAGRAAERGLKVLILEKNKKVGEKLRITGGGRCNITNYERDQKVLLKKYGLAEPFLYSLFSQFGVKDTISFFERKGLPLVVEAKQRMFPQSQNAGDVVRVLEKYLSQGNVAIHTSSPVTKIEVDNKKIQAVVCHLHRYTAKNYVFATGCMSHSETGSTGDGFLWLHDLGHRVVRPTPTIVPLKVSNRWIKKLAGVSLSDIAITFYRDNVKQFTLQGKILCTHFGLSGPLILNVASQVGDLLRYGVVTARIDMFPKISLGELEKKIIDIFDNNKNKTLKNVLKEIVLEGTAKGIILLLEKEMDVRIQVNAITKEQRKMLVSVLKNLLVDVVGLMDFDKAVIADGGIPLEEIEMKTMRSKIIENLFITGDLLHIRRPSGGFSLQLCWSSGYVAGSHVDSL